MGSRLQGHQDGKRGGGWGSSRADCRNSGGRGTVATVAVGQAAASAAVEGAAGVGAADGEGQTAVALVRKGPL
jgi:hypothetical protein